MWQQIKSWFKDSETIFFARLQVLVGIIASTDPYLFQPLFGEYFPFFLIGSGLLTEYLRRRREESM